MTCVAYGCSNRSSKKLPGVSFHRFPKNEFLKAKWVAAIRRVNFTPSHFSRICSDHFQELDFDRCSTLRVYLQPNSVPSVFKAFPSQFPKHFPKVTVTRKKPGDQRPSVVTTNVIDCVKSAAKNSDIQLPNVDTDNEDDCMDSPVLECLMKATITAMQCEDSSVQAQLLLEILNHCIYFHEYNNDQVISLKKYLSNEIKKLISNLEINETSKEIIKRFQNTLEQTQEDKENGVKE